MFFGLCFLKAISYSTRELFTPVRDPRFSSVGALLYYYNELMIPVCRGGSCGTRQGGGGVGGENGVFVDFGGKSFFFLYNDVDC